VPLLVQSVEKQTAFLLQLVSCRLDIPNIDAKKMRRESEKKKM
jgi:hypothetical protein